MHRYFLDFWVIALLIFVPAAFASDANQYILGDGDRISIRVYNEEELSMDILLTTRGSFNYPYLGRLEAAGKSVTQLQRIIERGLKGRYLIDPKVTVNVIQFRKFYVNGEVNQPGGYDYQPGLTVAKAIAIAGGFTDRASRSKIYLTQPNNGKKNYKSTLSQPVGPSDIIVVEQSFF